MFIGHSKTESYKEIFVDGNWVSYDSCGKDTEESREFYRRCGEVPFIQGAFTMRIDGVVQSNPTHLVFYRIKTA
jgi:hypothetical protein